MMIQNLQEAIVNNYNCSRLCVFLFPKAPVSFTNVKEKQAFHQYKLGELPEHRYLRLMVLRSPGQPR